MGVQKVVEVKWLKGRVLEVHIERKIYKKITCVDDPENPELKRVYGALFVKKGGKIVPKKKFLDGVEYAVSGPIGSLWIPDEYYNLMARQARGIFAGRREKKPEQLELPRINLPQKKRP